MFRTAFLAASVASATIFTCSSLVAGPLPNGAVKMTPTEIRALYAGKTANWSDTMAYFAPDGRVYMYGKKKDWYGEGTWSVTGNRICRDLTWFAVTGGKTGKARPMCWTWYKHGNRNWSLWSGMKDKRTGWGYKEMRKFSNGDKVTRTVAALKRKAGN